MNWKSFFPNDLMYAPSFDARAVCYPSDKNLRDYLSWRQADCHINNLYNTAFWMLVQDKNASLTETEAEDQLKDTDSAAKNELLFSKYGINYAHLESIYRKGSFIFRRKRMVQETTKSGSVVKRRRTLIEISHEDIIGDEFWKRTELLKSQ